MTKGITEKEPNPRIVYAGYIDMPHHVSPTRPQMSLYDRAAQFSPFAALSGYEEMIEEEARWVDKQIELDDSEIERINFKFNLIEELIESGCHPTVSITYFKPDSKKDGGKYVTCEERVYGIDTIGSKLVLTRTTGISKVRASIEIGKIADIHGEDIDFLDEGE